MSKPLVSRYTISEAHVPGQALHLRHQSSDSYVMVTDGVRPGHPSATQVELPARLDSAREFIRLYAEVIGLEVSFPPKVAP